MLNDNNDLEMDCATIKPEHMSLRMKPIQWPMILSVALALCVGCSRTDSSEPLSQPPSHGTVFRLQYDPAEFQGDSTALGYLKQAVDKRLWKLGISMYWQPTTNNEVRIWTPITREAQISKVEKALTLKGMLELRFVKDDSNALLSKGVLSAPGYELMKETNVFTRPSKTMQNLVKKEPALKPVLTNKYVEDTGLFMDRTPAIHIYLVKKEPELTGRYVQNAWVQTNQFGPEIDFQLNQDGAMLFQTITSNNVGRQLAIVVDGGIYSAPRIMAPIPGGRGMIAGNFTPKDAQELADVLDCPLPFAIKVTVEKTY